MPYEMLINWRCGMLYPEGTVHDFANLPKGTPPVTQEAIDYAVSQGYMVAVEKPSLSYPPPEPLKTPTTNPKK